MNIKHKTFTSSKNSIKSLLPKYLPNSLYVYMEYKAKTMITMFIKTPFDLFFTLMYPIVMKANGSNLYSMFISVNIEYKPSSNIVITIPLLRYFKFKSL